MALALPAPEHPQCPAPHSAPHTPPLLLAPLSSSANAQDKAAFNLQFKMSIAITEYKL